jgi:hypothetical protein
MIFYHHMKVIIEKYCNHKLIYNNPISNFLETLFFGQPILFLQPKRKQIKIVVEGHSCN